MKWIGAMTRRNILFETARLAAPGIVFALVIFNTWIPVSSRLEGAELIDRIVAVVNDDIILLSELNRELQPYAERIKSSGYSPVKENQRLFKIRTDLLNKLIDQKLTDQEIKRIKIFVSEKEVDNALERMKEANFYTDEEMRKMMAAQGLDMASYRQRLKDQILRSKLVNREVKSKIVITQEDIRSYYEAHQAQYGGEKKYHLRNLMMKISPAAATATRRNAQKRMEAVLEKLKAGEAFDKSDTIGRDLGLIGFQKLSPQLQAALKKMKPGEYTPVLDTDQGFQIFFVQEIVETPGKSLEEATTEIERTLYEEIVNKQFGLWLDNLRKRSTIKIIK